MAEQANTTFEYLHQLQKMGIQPGLERITRVAEALGNPERKFKSIHIAGTNGKGSTAAMIESVLREAGYKTGLYTSPDMYAYNERIRIHGEPISDIDLAAVIETVKSACEDAGITLPFFEFGTMLALQHFANQDVDIAVVEVGMGGLYDATNIVNPLVSVITNVELDHTEFLGTTRAEIAREKAGIIKKDTPLVIGSTKAEAREVIFDRAARMGAEIIGAENVEGVESVLRGDHQKENLATAITALNVFRERGGNISDEELMRGIAKTKWEGRMDIVSQEPLIIVDGAHNPAGARALASYIKQEVGMAKRLLFGAKQGKDASEMIAPLAPLFEEIVVTEANFEPMPAAELAKIARAHHSNVVAEPRLAKAMATSREQLKNHETLVVAGSLYLVADALALLRGRSYQHQYA